MTKDCVLNELSFRDIDERSHDLACLLVRLAELPRLLGADAVVWACNEHDDRSNRAGDGFGRCRDAAFSLPRGDDQGRLAKSFLQRIQRFDTSRGCDARHERGRGRGLALAHDLCGLALSLDVAPWQRSLIEIDVSKIIENAIWSGRAEVKHATQKAHLEDHLPWPKLTETDRLRILLGTVGVRHVPASEYRKHVCGHSNHERRESACQPTAPGQYFAEIDGVPVIDETIRSWEHEVLDSVRGERPCRMRVEQRGSKRYFVYCELRHEVGFKTGGTPTRWMRLEWTEGHVHSHPREPASSVFSR